MEVDMPTPHSFDPDGIPDMSIPERNGNAPKPPKQSERIDGAIGKKPAAWDAPTSAGGWKVGDRVLAPWEPIFLYSGTIKEIKKSKALIQFDDGDSGWVFVDQLRTISVKKDQAVLSRRKMGAIHYPAKILQVRGDEVLVGFDDRSGEEWTRIAALRIPCEEELDGAQPVTFASNQVFISQLKKGDRVWAPWMGGVLFVGTVAGIRNEEAEIHFDDGDKGWVRLDQLSPFEAREGMRVMSRWKMGQQYFPGVVTKVSGNRVYIHYDDGDEEWTTPAALAIPSNPGGPDARPIGGGGPGRPAPGAGAGIGMGTVSPALLLWLIPVGIAAVVLLGIYGCRN
jgi:hypothetical protein